MKIMFAIGTMSKCGAQRVVTNLSNYLKEKGNDVSIVATIGTDSFYSLNSGINVYFLDEDNTKSFITKNIYRIKRLKEIVKDKTPDIIVSFLPEPSFRMLFLKLFNRKLKVIVSVRNNPKIEYASFLFRVVMKLLYPIADGFVFQTEDAKSYFKKGIQKKSVIIPNPISSDFIDADINESKKNLIISVGRLEEQKNYKLLINAFKNIADKIKEYNLIIYGEGSLRTELEKQIKELGLEGRVLLYGSTDQVKEKLNEGKIFVLSSAYEGMPNALMEAMAMGLACISTDCPSGGPKFLIKHDINGILVKPNDEYELANSILELATDASKIKRLSKEAIKIREELSPAKINALWEEYIKGQMNEKNNNK